MMQTNRRMAPRQLPVCEVSLMNNPMMSRHIRLPCHLHITNQMKYVMAMTCDAWIRKCASSFILRKCVETNSRYQSLLQQYLLISTQLQTMFDTIKRDRHDWISVMEVNEAECIDFHNRYAMRTEELEKAKRELNKKMIMNRIYMISLFGYEFVNCLFQIFALMPAEFFTQLRHDTPTLIVQYGCLWLMSVCEPKVPFHAVTTETIISTLETYIDYRMEKEPDQFLMRGIDHFLSISCTNFFDAVFYYNMQMEAIVLLMIAKRYENYQTSKKAANVRGIQYESLTAKSRFFLSVDVVRVVASFLCEGELGLHPIFYLWL